MQTCRKTVMSVKFMKTQIQKHWIYLLACLLSTEKIALLNNVYKWGNRLRLTLILLNSDQKELKRDFSKYTTKSSNFSVFRCFCHWKKLWKPSLTWLLYSYTIIQYEAYLFNIWWATRWWCLKKPRRLTFTCLSK